MALSSACVWQGYLGTWNATSLKAETSASVFGNVSGGSDNTDSTQSINSIFEWSKKRLHLLHWVPEWMQPLHHLRAQQARMGGINLSSSWKANLYRPKATHVIEIDTEKSMEKGIFFFGNRFTGAWEIGAWKGKVSLECLWISCRKWYGFLGFYEGILCG